MNSKALLVTKAAIVAALYVVLTFVSASIGLSSGVIQLRLSEMLCILPAFTPAAIPGLFVGCIVSNLLTGCMPLDVIFGSLATLIGALGTYFLKKRKWLTPLPPIVSNTMIVPFVLSYVYGFEGSIPFFMLTVGIGEFLSCGVLGMLLYFILHKYAKHLF